MKVCITANEDYMFMNEPLLYFLKNTTKDICGIIIVTKNPQFINSIAYRLKSALMVLLCMRVKYIFRLARKVFHANMHRLFNHSSCEYFLEEYAQKNKIPVYKTNDPNESSCTSMLNHLSPDVIIHQSKFILNKTFLEIPNICTINRHGGILPEFRGMLAPFWTLYQHRSHGGITIHCVDEMLDHGKIVIQEKIPLQKGECLGSLLEKIFSMSGSLLVKAIDKIDSHKNDYKYSSSPSNKGENDSGYFSFPKASEIITLSLIVRNMTKHGKL